MRERRFERAIHLALGERQMALDPVRRGRLDARPANVRVQILDPRAHLRKRLRIAERFEPDRRLAERRARLDPEEDVLTRLIQGRVEGARAAASASDSATSGSGSGEDSGGDRGDAAGLSESQLVHNCIFLLNAGHETTANLIGNGIDALMRHPQEQRRLVEEPALIASAIEELLRFESPLQLNNRSLTAALDVGGQVLEAGTLVTLCIGAANRDPAQFSDPECLDIARKPNRQLAFGHGEHACAGMNVARMEARIALGALLARHPRIAHAGPPVRDRRVRFRGFTRLPVVLAGG